MTSLTSIFKDVLLRENSITVPGFGTFETSYQSAQLDEKTGVIHPPTKLVVLNTDKTDDPENKLVKSIVQNQGLSEDTAKDMVKDFVALVNNKLSANNSVTLDEVGIIYKDNNGKPALKAIPSNLSIDNYGMDSVEVEPVKEADRVVAAVNTSRGKTVKSDSSSISKVSTTKTTTTTTETTTTKTEKKKKSKLLWVLLILLPILAILTVLFFIYKDQLLGNNTKNNVADVKEEPVEMPTDPLGDGNIIEEDDDIAKTDSEPINLERTDINNGKKNSNIDSDLEILARAGFSNVSPQNLGSKYKKYYLVGGSFRDQAKANSERRRLGAKEILNVEGSDLYRVIFVGSDSAQEIVDVYNSALARGIRPEAMWLLKNSK